MDSFSEIRDGQDNRRDWVGVFDSGVGGLSVVRELLRELPAENIYFFGDNLHNPYGMRSLDTIRDLSETITRKLLQLPAKAVVLACNTASAAALAYLRECFPGTPFIGMEPAVKPAALESRTGTIGVLATPATFQGEPFKKLRAAFGDDAEILSQPCPGLADAIEQYGPDDARVTALLRRFIEPLLPRRIDQLVLACTHYALVLPTIVRIAGPEVQVVDPSPAVARQVRRVLEKNGLATGDGTGTLAVRVSGETEAFSRVASVFLGQPVAAARNEFFPDAAASAKIV